MNPFGYFVAIWAFFKWLFKPKLKVHLTMWAQKRGGKFTLPKKHGDVGFDLYFAGDKALTIQPGECVPVPTGLHIDIPTVPKFVQFFFRVYLLIIARTSLGMIGIKPGARVVDSGYRPPLMPSGPRPVESTPQQKEYDKQMQDYREGLKLQIENVSNEPKTFKPGDRVAQGVFHVAWRPPEVQMVGIEEINQNTERGSGRFGSTGR